MRLERCIMIIKKTHCSRSLPRLFENRHQKAWAACARPDCVISTSAFAGTHRQENARHEIHSQTDTDTDTALWNNSNDLQRVVIVVAIARHLNAAAVVVIVVQTATTTTSCGCRAH